MGKGAIAVKTRRNSMSEADLKAYAQQVQLPSKAAAQGVPVVKGEFDALPAEVKEFLTEQIVVCQPKALYICDGSQEEANELTEKLVKRGMLKKLDKMENCYLCRTDPADVARVEGRTFIVTDEKYESVPHVAEGEKGILGQWMGTEQAKKEMTERFTGCMQGRNMYVLPFSMGPVGGRLSKTGVQITDSSYVVLSMRIMATMDSGVWDVIRTGDKFVRCVHSMGAPRPVQKPVINHWPCNPEKILICHFPDQHLAMSYGSGYGGNSLLGKKCFALRLASRMARDEGWLAEHMLILSVTDPAGNEKFIAAAFPSACGKTNLAMLKPALPGWKVQCIGDDIAWMRFDDEGKLRAINPETGFFGVAPGTNHTTNPNAMDTFQKNSIFTNVGMTADGGIYWEGLEKEIPADMDITTWLGEEGWRVGDKGNAAHPNSRFCCPARQCPIIHPKWQDPDGVVIDAIVFGGRRPEGVPLIVEARDWQHGVLMGASLKSQTTAAAEFKGRLIMHDPMAMRPFFGYNFGQYLEHWLSLQKPGRHMPKIFHVNWFRREEKTGAFLWPGFGDNIRVLEWICRRVDEVSNLTRSTAIGLVPSIDGLNTDGLTVPDMEQLLSVPTKYWREDMKEMLDFLQKQVGSDLPEVIFDQIQQQMQRVEDYAEE